MTSTDVRIPGYVAGTWTIDAIHSHVGFVIKHMMVSKVRGRFATFSGQITTAPDPRDSSVSVTIDAASVDTANQMRDDHIRSADFFEAGNHPAITFASARTKAGFSATTEVNRTDFGVSYNGPIPGGRVALAEKAQIVLEVEADLQGGS